MMQPQETPHEHRELDSEKSIVMIVTVGGTPDPLISAISFWKPAAVWMLYSDGADGSQSSKPVADSIRERFPEIKFYQRGCAPDDPDKTHALASLCLDQMLAGHPAARRIADFTGGTKSMSGGLLMAALGGDGIEVQFMSGRRADLRQVEPGSEAPKLMAADAVLAERDLRRIAAHFDAYDYEPAHRHSETLVKRLIGTKDALAPVRKTVRAARTLSAIFDEWDRFRHGAAAKLARSSYEEGELPGSILEASGLFQPLLDMAVLGRKQSNWRLCADLWRNADRCGSRGRYDDAVARLYRLTEAAVQAQLYQQYQIPNPPPWDRVPEQVRAGVRPEYDKGEKVAKLGLDRSVELLRVLNGSDPLAKALDFGGRPEWTANRNNSILAHGFSSIDENTWKTARKWVDERLRPFWKAVEPPQFPQGLLDLIAKAQAEAAASRS